MEIPGASQRLQNATKDGSRTSRQRSPSRGHTLGLWLSIGAFVVLAGILSFGRQYLGYATETDYLGGFLPEANRFLSFEPLAMDFHPPLYPITIGLTNLFTADWFLTGRLVSLVSAVVALLSSYFFFRGLAGPWAAFGSLAGLVGSAVFIYGSAAATSDVFTLALFLLSFLLTLLALQGGGRAAWFGSGFAIGLCLISRTNSIALLPLLGSPWLLPETSRVRINTLQMLAGMLVPVGLFVTYALMTGSNLLPTENHSNLAMTYFSNSWDRISGEAYQQVSGQFSSLWEVMLHDPSRMARLYVVDLGRLILRVPSLLEFPLQLLFLPGLIFLIIGRFTKMWLPFLAVCVAQVLLNNFKAFEARYYLFLLPFFGAGAGEMVATVLRSIPQPGLRTVVAFCFALGAAGSVGVASRNAHYSLYAAEAELREAVPAADKVLPEGATILARKAVVAYHTDARAGGFPDVESLEELREFIENEPNRDAAYLYYGQIEKALREEFLALLDPKGAPPWLRPVARSAEPGGWVLYRYLPEQEEMQ